MKVAALILTMFLATISAAGQVTSPENTISNSEFTTVDERAGNLLSSTLRKRVTTIKEFTKNRSIPFKISEKIVREFDRPSGLREVIETYGKVRVIRERISTGRQTHTRTDNGPWTEAANRSFDLTLRSFYPETHQFRRLLSVELDGEKVDYYEINGTVYGTSCDGVGECTKFPYQVKYTSWISSNGMVLKRVMETDRGQTAVWRETITYEYDPKDLKIEAPIN